MKARGIGRRKSEHVAEHIHDRLVTPAVADDDESEPTESARDHSAEFSVLLLQFRRDVLQVFRAIVAVDLDQQWPPIRGKSHGRSRAVIQIYDFELPSVEQVAIESGINRAFD